MSTARWEITFSDYYYFLRGHAVLLSDLDPAARFFSGSAVYSRTLKSGSFSVFSQRDHAFFILNLLLFITISAYCEPLWAILISVAGMARN